jgi:catechol 2,3-dioxygenase-like lactoylglutathione lyase family enzyme
VETIMRDFRDAKAMAQTLRENLKTPDAKLSVSDSLELVAKQFGFENWNVLVAKINQARAVEFAAAIPILRIFDEAKTKEFYFDWLGFKMDWQGLAHEGAPNYMQVSRGDLVLHLSEHHGDAAPGATAFVLVKDIAALHAELIGKNYKYNKPGVEDGPGGKTLQVNDPFGNRLRFVQRREGPSS